MLQVGRARLAATCPAVTSRKPGMIFVSCARTAPRDRRRSPALPRARTRPSVRTCRKRCVPVALLPLHDRDPLQGVANRAAGLDQLLAGPARQRDGGRGRRARPEIGDEILNDGVGLARRQLRAAQDHVVDVILPSDRPVPAGHEDVQGVALRAGGGDEIAAVALRQRAAVWAWSGAPAPSTSAASAPRSERRIMVTPSSSAGPRPSTADARWRLRPGRRGRCGCRADRGGRRRSRAGRGRWRP